MDKFQRLTRADEWQVGRTYFWAKGGVVDPRPLIFVGWEYGGSYGRFTEPDGNTHLSVRATMLGARFIAAPDNPADL